jgi:hypothetical protein
MPRNLFAGWVPSDRRAVSPSADISGHSSLPVRPTLAIGWNQSAVHQRRMNCAGRWRNDASLKPAMSVISRVARFFGRMVREIETNHQFLVNTRLMEARAPSAGEAQHCPNLSRHMYFDRQSWLAIRFIRFRLTEWKPGKHSSDHCMMGSAIRWHRWRDEGGCRSCDTANYSSLDSQQRLA